MFNCILNRVVVRLEDIKREVDLGNGQKLILDYGDREKRQMAAVTEGVVVSIGPEAYNDYGYTIANKPIKVGDKVQFAKYAAVNVFDTEMADERLAIINDEDVLGIITSKGESNE